jgi:hypothetical protein
LQTKHQKKHGHLVRAFLIIKDTGLGIVKDLRKRKTPHKVQGFGGRAIKKILLPFLV